MAEPTSTGPTAPELLAAIDIGSNSIHMLVVEAESGGGFRVLGREKEMVRLGRSAFAHGALSEAAMERALDALAKVTTLARLKGARRIVAVATSAVREAVNGAEFVRRVRRHTGLEVRLLSGDEEGRLIYRAVREAVDLGRGAAVILDLGGGSTEWIVTRSGELDDVASLALGSLRCAAMFPGETGSDRPPAPSAIVRLRRRIRAELASLPKPATVERAVATSGTAIACLALADLAAGREVRPPAAGARELKAKELRKVVEDLGRRSRAELVALGPVGEPRAESILAGAVLLDELVRHAGVDRLLVCDRALREGLVLEALGRPLPDSAPEEARRRQVVRFARKVESVFAHGEQTARLAVRLFDVLASVHGLGGRERELLEYAALLHDVGMSIDYRGHHRHSFYLITHAGLDAFDPEDLDLVALVARYHRGRRPRATDPELAGRPAWQRRTVQRLAALLRVADALDRTHARRVRDLYGSIRKKRVRLEVISDYDVALELEAAGERKKLFEKTFGVQLALTQGLEEAG